MSSLYDFLSGRRGRRTRGRGWFEALPRRTELLKGELPDLEILDSVKLSSDNHNTALMSITLLTIRRDNASVPLYVLNEDNDEEVERARKKAEKEEREERNRFGGFE